MGGNDPCPSRPITLVVPYAAGSGFYYLVSGPANLPPDITAKLNSEIAGMLNDVRDPLLALGLVAERSTPEAIGALIKSDVARWKELVTSARITVE